jgi:hypothetical protein
MSDSRQMASPIDEEIAPVAADGLALGSVFPGQPASRFSLQSTAPQMAPDDSDSRRVSDRDGIHRKDGDHPVELFDFITHILDIRIGENTVGHSRQRLDLRKDLRGK